MEEELQGQPEEVIEAPVDGTPVAQVGEVEPEIELEEDPDAWRVTRWSDDPSEIALQLNALVERSPQIKRQLGMVAAQQGAVRREREEKARISAELEAANAEREQLRFEVKHAKYGNLSREQVGQLIARDPSSMAEIQEYAKMRQERAQPRQQTPAYITNLTLEAQNFADQVAPHLSPEIEQYLRQAVESPELYAAYKDHPMLLIPDLQRRVAELMQVPNNGAQVGTTPRQAAPVTDGSAPRNVPAVQGNSRIGRRTPDQTPTRRTSGSAEKYTVAEIRAMPQGQFEALKEKHGAQTMQGLIDSGVVAV